MYELPNARPSPRIVNGVLKWYEGDTFELDVELQVTDQDGETVNISDTDTVEFVFKDCRREIIKTFSFAKITDNTVTLVFDKTVSAMFPKGEYTCDVYLVGERRITLAKDDPVVVQ